MLSKLIKQREEKIQKNLNFLFIVHLVVIKLLKNLIRLQKNMMQLEDAQMMVLDVKKLLLKRLNILFLKML